MPQQVPASLEQTAFLLGQRFHYPGNLGVEFRTLRIGKAETEHTQVLAVFVRGLSDEELVRLWCLEPLARLTPADIRAVAAAPDGLCHLIPAPRVTMVDSLSKAVDGILQGATACFFDGLPQAMLIHTESPGHLQKTAAFGDHLMENVTLIRTHLRHPDLIAEPFTRSGTTTCAAFLYIHGQTRPQLVARVREWLEKRGTQQPLHRGGPAGKAARYGLLPDLLSTTCPEKAAALLDRGYVVILSDHTASVYAAPVTAAALLYDVSDDQLLRSVTHLKRLFRLGLAWLVLLDSGLILAVIEYHHELLTTPFLLALTAIRETAAFPVVGEVMGLELLQDLVWNIDSRRRTNISLGQMALAFFLVVFYLTLTGMVGPLTGTGAIVAFIGTMGLRNADLFYTVRIWRWAFLFGAVMFGLYGMTAVAFLLVAYVTQAQSFGVPFAGDTGLRQQSSPSTAGKEQGAG